MTSADTSDPPDRSLEVRILGTISVQLAGRPAQLGDAKHRLMLAMLIAAEGRLVPTGQLIDQIWDDHPPEKPREQIHTYAANLRKSLETGLPGAAKMLPRHHHGGYQFLASRDSVDLYAFRDLRSRAMSIPRTDDPQAVTLLRLALSRWDSGGDGPLADLTSTAVSDCKWVNGFRQTLREERRAALIGCLEAELRLGQHERITAELADLSAADPLDERVAALLMLAYYRGGRATMATDLFLRTRELLRTEHGAEPSQHIRKLHQRILNQDPDLDLPVLSGARATKTARHSRELTRDTGHGSQAPAYLVGRDSEVSVFESLLESSSGRSLLNIYGPSGIGKSAVYWKLLEHARGTGFLAGGADVSMYGSGPVALLRELTRSMLEHDQADGDGALRAFAGRLDEFDAVNEFVESAGGVNELYDIVGSPRDEIRLNAMFGEADANLPEAVRATMRNRFALERYQRGAGQRLTSDFAGVLAAVADESRRTVILLDTYEEVRALDTWVRRALIPAMPDSALLVILGRNHLPKQNFDWSDHADFIRPRLLPELAEDEAKSYLRHYGLTDPSALDEVYRFTGGYPLLLVLARQLADGAGGWESVGNLDQTGDRDVIASQLLARILREERVHEVRDVLEKCAIATWINPEIIQALLRVSPAEARESFEKARTHSFMERHPEGVRLHEKIRKLLIERLRFTSKEEFDILEERLLAYHSSKVDS